MERLIFIIDDDHVYLNFMKSHFRQMKEYNVETYPNGDDALSALGTKTPFMIILDHNLSDSTKNGTYYLKHIKKLKPEVPVVYITADSSDILKKQTAKLGASSHIVKSESSLIHLRTAIDEIVTPKKKGLLSKLFK